MRGWRQEELLSSISVAQLHPRTLEDSFLVSLFVLEDDLYPLQGHHHTMNMFKNTSWLSNREEAILPQEKAADLSNKRQTQPACY